MTKKFKRRNLILAEANRLFAEKGFSDTSLEDIAESVGIKRESLYYYYPSRYDLLYDIIAPQISRVMENFTAIIAEETDSRIIIRRGIGSHLQHFNSSYFHMVMAVRKNSRGDVQIKFIQLRDMFKSYEKLWRNMIHEGQKTGDIRSDTPPELLVYSILGLCNSLSSWYRTDGPLSLDQIGRYYADIILDGTRA